MESNKPDGSAERFIVFACPNCEKKTGFSAALAGQVSQCPLCKAQILVPERSGEQSFVVGGAPSAATPAAQQKTVAASPRPAPKTARTGVAKKAGPPISEHGAKAIPAKPRKSNVMGMIAAGVAVVAICGVAVWAFTRNKPAPAKEVAMTAPKAAAPETPPAKKVAPADLTKPASASVEPAMEKPRYTGLGSLQSPDVKPEKSDDAGNDKKGKASVAENWAEEFIKNGPSTGGAKSGAAESAPVVKPAKPEDERQALLGKQTKKSQAADDDEERAEKALAAQPSVSKPAGPVRVEPPPEPVVEIRTPHPELVSKIVTQIDAAIKASNESETARQITALAETNAPDAVTRMLGYVGINNKLIFEAVRNGLATINHENALKTMLAAYKNAYTKTGWTTRVLLLDAFGAQRESPEALEAFRSGVQNDHPKVRLAAIRALGKNKFSLKESVPLLVAAIAAAEKNSDFGTPHIEARRLLVTLTGYDFARAKEWQSFLAKPGTDFVKNHGKAVNASLQDESYYYDKPVTSQRLLFVIDTSGSMSEGYTTPVDTKDMPKYPDVARFVYNERQPERKGGKWVGREGERQFVYDPSPEYDKWLQGYQDAYQNWLAQHPEVAKAMEEYQDKYQAWALKHPSQFTTRMEMVKAELSALIQKLPQTATFNIIAFNNTVSPWQKTLSQASPAVKAEALAFVKSLQPYGETSTDLALESAFENNWQADTVYLLSDGEPSRNGTDPLPVPPILSRVQELNRYHRIIIHTLMVGHEGMAFMKSLAAENAGIYEDISKKDQVPANDGNPFIKIVK